MADMTDDTTCEKCHVAGNLVGAPPRVLPSKSFMCILCHNAPLAMGHPIFGVAFLIFLMGIFATLYFWYQGKVCGEEESIQRKIGLSSETLWTIIFSRQFFGLLKVFILDIVFQRRLLQESVQRWSMHALIFTSILLRLVLGLFTSVGFFFNPESDMMLALIDKNHAFTSFANDLLGLFILLGILWAVAQRYIIKPAHVKTEIQDNLALIIIGLLVVLGFVLEAARIASTGIPADMTGGAFIGAPLAAILGILGLDWSAVYPYLWYAHGIMAALLIAYLPFGKMRHVFNTPLTYFIEKVAGVKRGDRV
jgi:nitrate reductase gamma subunit